MDEGSENEAGEEPSPNCPVQVEDEHAIWLHPLPWDGEESRISAGTSSGRNDAPLQRGMEFLVFSHLGPRLVWMEVHSFAFHKSLSASGSNSQNLHRALDYFIHGSGKVGWKTSSSVIWQAWTLLFNISLVPEELNFVQPDKTF